MSQPLPDFALKMNTVYNSAVSHCFILHGSGVVDYADNENGLVEGVLNRLWGNHTIVCHYSMATGITFPVKEIKKTVGGKESIVVEQPSQQAFLKAIGAKPEEAPDDALGTFKDVNKAIPLFDMLLKKRGEVIPATDEKGKPRFNDKGNPITTTKPFFALIVHMAEFIIPDGDMAVRPQPERKLISIMERWGRDPEVMGTGNVVVLTTRALTDVHQRLRLAGARYEAVEMPIPNYDDRLSYIKFIRARPSSAFEYADIGGGATDKGDEAFARLTAGLSRVGIEDIVYKAIPNKLDRASITARKDEIIRTEYADVIEMLDPNFGFDAVGGYTPIKEMFSKRIVARVKEGLPSDWPGVLLVGPPGTGKTTLAVALANECGIPALRLNIGALKNKFVGETEKNLRRALGLIREMAPVLVFIDEIDTALPNRQDENQDSGVSKGILEAFMPFLSDPAVRLKTQFVAASNRSDGIDAALKRVGRLDKIIPMLMPVKQERVEIIKALWPIEDSVKDYPMPSDKAIRDICADLQYTVVKVTARVEGGEFKDVKSALADMDVGWSGSEIRGLIRAAGEEIRDDPKLSSDEALAKAKEYVIANTADVLRLTALALADCNDLRLLPESYRKAYDKTKWAQEAKLLGAETAVPSQVERTRRNN
jgi:SpoVK/Ycf46/Vps4 family AAA+-type ATPase